MSEVVLSYYAAVRRLRDALEQNRNDIRFSDDDRQIVYLLDTNVVEYYLHEIESSASGRLSFGDLLNDRVAAQVSDRLTVEYLLSGSLPGQHDPLTYLSAPHWNETLERADRVARAIARFQAGLQLPGVERLQRLGLTDPRELVARAREVFPEEVIKAVMTASSVERRLRAAFIGEAGADPLIQPLESSDYWNAARDRVTRQDFSDWRRILARLRTERRTGPAEAGKAKPVQDNTHNVEADAWTLAHIQTMYRENPESCNDSRRLLFLFVTADQSILRAMHEREAALEDEGIPNFVRHPRVFSPILNSSSMTSVGLRGVQLPETLKAVFVEVEEALDRLLEFTPGRDALRRKPEHWDLTSSLQSWASAARELANLNAGLFSSDDERIKSFAELFHQPAVLDTASTMLKNTISSIRSEHTRIQSGEALKQLTRQIVANASERASYHERRAPLKIVGVDVLEAVRPVLPDIANPDPTDTGLESFLAMLPEWGHGPAGARRIAGLGELLQAEWQRPSSQLFAACIYLALGKWQSARDCALRCYAQSSAANNWKWRREANYCLALADRILLRGVTDFDEALSSLEENIANFGFERDRESRIAMLRDHIERAALQLAASITEAIEPFDGHGSIGSDGDEIRLRFGSAVDSMRKAADVLDDDFSGDAGDLPLIVHLRIQLFTNTLGAEIYRLLLNTQLSEQAFDVNRLVEARERLMEEGFDEELPHFSHLYLAIAALLLDTGETNEEQVQDMLKLALEEKDLPYADKIEFHYLLRHVQARQSSQPARV